MTLVIWWYLIYQPNSHLDQALRAPAEVLLDRRKLLVQ